ncbi:MAG: anti-sigma factor [Bacteroidota bacterium]|nr:anti-sigma factor [Bacteroidota bacterium]
MEKEQFEELCASYAVGALGAHDEKMLFDAIKLGGEAFEKIFSDYSGTSFLLNQSVVREIPSPKVKLALLNTIQKQEKRSPFSFLVLAERLALSLGFGSPRFGFIVSLLLVVVILEVGTLAYVMHDDAISKEHQIARMESQLNDQQRRTAPNNGVQTKEEMLAVLQSPKMEMVLMNGQQVNPAGYGKIMWDPERKSAVLQVSKLPALPADKDYQLWFLDKNKTPVSAGVFSVTTDQENMFKVFSLNVPDKKEITAFAVTMEPKGGMPQPTGTMYLLGATTL